MFVAWKVEHVPFVDNAWDDSQMTTFTNIHRPLIRNTLGEQRGTFEFTVLNDSDKTFSDLFNPYDKLFIYRKINSTEFTDEDLLIQGGIKDVPTEEDANKDELKIEGFNFGDVILGALMFVDATDLKVDEALQQGLTSIGQGNPNFLVEWDAGNPSVKTDGTEFPIVNQPLFNYPYLRIIRRYSTQNFNEDQNYYFYVSKDNKLIWRPIEDSTFGTFNHSTDTYNSLKVYQDTSEVRNFIIIRGGTSPKGNAIQENYRDPESISRHGQKYHIMIDENRYAQTTYERDLERYAVDTMEDATYPLSPNPPWNQGNLTPTSFNDYNDKLVTYVKALLKKDGQRFAETRRWGRLQADVAVQPGTLPWQVGNMINCTLPEYPNQVKELRVQSAQYAEDEDTFTLIEDVGTV